MAELGFFVGALVATFLISRLMLWLLKSWDGGAPRLVFAHAASWVAASFLAGMGMADGGAFAGARAAMSYALPQALWLIVDLVRNQAPSAAPEIKDRPPAAEVSSKNQILWFSLALAGMILVSWGIIQFASSQQPSPQSGPWDYSWEEPAEAPADAAAIPEADPTPQSDAP